MNKVIRDYFIPFLLSSSFSLLIINTLNQKDYSKKAEAIYFLNLNHCQKIEMKWIKESCLKIVTTNLKNQCILYGDQTQKNKDHCQKQHSKESIKPEILNKTLFILSSSLLIIGLMILIRFIFKLNILHRNSIEISNKEKALLFYSLFFLIASFVLFILIDSSQHQL